MLSVCIYRVLLNPETPRLAAVLLRLNHFDCLPWCLSEILTRLSFVPTITWITFCFWFTGGSNCVSFHCAFFFSSLGTPSHLFPRPINSSPLGCPVSHSCVLYRLLQAHWIALYNWCYLWTWHRFMRPIWKNSPKQFIPNQDLNNESFVCQLSA